MPGNQISFEELLFTETQAEIQKNPPTSSLQQDIVELLQSNVTSVLEICEVLIKKGKLKDERFSSNKPKSYPEICIIIDELVQRELVQFIEDQDKKDRIYKWR
ncbi:DUF3895 domain-containing protein [Peribacillus asahii]|uniref:DUF3895 domain-containing protein n=1 Tax=Peribacillus asahii TaxID=228899 RepID=UPI00207AD956|nr:DUF3895 domain-containing protein [Peribacillus asahii]USK72229.1 DUF3895 domain-containing protein [Peribacillus asahii]